MEKVLKKVWQIIGIITGIAVIGFVVWVIVIILINLFE